MRKVFISLALFLFIGLCAAGIAVYWGWNQIYQAPSKDETEVVIQVKDSESFTTVTSDLVKNHLVNSPKLFNWFAGITRQDKNLKPGTYSLYKNMNYPQILEALSSGKTKTVWFTIPEGWTLAQIADKLESLDLLKKADFLAEAKVSNFDFPFLSDLDKDSSLEGYLFPDTYKVEAKTTAHDVILKMLENFSVKINTINSEISQKGKTIDDIVILASIIEKESGNTKDQKLISSVFNNRLDQDYPLESDTTIQYITGGGRFLTDEQLSDPSPYNSYKHAGLPPTAICNPGLSALEAAINPESSDYFFFLSDAQGNVYFAKTMEEQIANRNKYMNQ